MRICQLLLQTYRKEDFVKEIFRQMVHWEPDEQTVAHYEECLNSGVSKNEIMIQILNIPEANNLYSLPPPEAEEERRTVAQRLQYLMNTYDEDFVGGIYREILYRDVEPHSFGLQIDALRQGVPRISLVSGFLASEEWYILLARRHVFSARILAHFLSTIQGVENP
jgi:hypothetical protein